jgi:hypothetical protein
MVHWKEKQFINTLDANIYHFNLKIKDFKSGSIIENVKDGLLNNSRENHCPLSRVISEPKYFPRYKI